MPERLHRLRPRANSPAPNDDMGPDRAGAAAGRPRRPARAAGRPLTARTDPHSMAAAAPRRGSARHDRRHREPAGVSRATFYELFKDKEDCFHATMELSLAEAMGRIVAVYSPDKPWATMVRDAAATFLDLLATRPGFARMALVEAPLLGRARLRALRLGQEGAAIAARTRPRRSGRGTGDPFQRRARRPRRRRVADRRPDPRRQHRALERAAAGHRLHHMVPYLGQEEALRQSRQAEKAVAPADG